MTAVRDARKRVVVVPGRAERVVSLVPSITEWLVAAGVGRRLVGVTDWCTEPAEVVASIPKVRGTKNPDRKRIEALQPDLVIANHEENRRVDVERLEAAGIPVVVTMAWTVAGAISQLRMVADAVGGLPHAGAIDADLTAALRRAYRERPARQVRYACAIWRDPWMWLGRRTYAADLLALAGGTPVLADPATRYPRLEPEAVRALDPEVVLLPSEPYAFGPADREEAAAWAQAVHLVDGKALFWYGPRIPAALASLRELLGAWR